MVLAGGLALADRFFPTAPVVRGLSIGERVVVEPSRVSEWLKERSDALGERIVHFRSGARSFDSPLREAGVTIDIEATLAEASRVGHRGGLFRRLTEAERARRGAIDVPLIFSVDEQKARALIASWADEVHRPPMDARADIANHEKIPDVAGTELDVEPSVRELMLASYAEEETIELATKSIAAKVTLDDLVRVDISKVLSTHETDFVTWGVGVGRSRNIRNAASKIDGVVIAPGEEFSFNARVGPRTTANGFTWAPEIVGDELMPGVGGGTCQVSTTLHIAAVFGGLDIVERKNHSHASAYAKLGLDATVVYPSTDLRIRNTMTFPVMIRAYLPKATNIRVELLGGDPIAKVTYAYSVGSTEDFVRRITVKDNLKPGTRIRHQKGIRGFDVTSVVTLEYLDGRHDRHAYFSAYNAAPEVYWVAPGYDESELPPLPEHASGVEGHVAAKETPSEGAM